MISKTVEINSGKNIIDISFDGLVICLSITKPIVADWYDNEGSMGRYFALNSDYDREKYIQELNDILVNGNDEIILEKITGFLDLFNSDSYTIYLEESKLDYNTIHNEYGNIKGTSYHYYSFYDDNDYNIMFTQPLTSISNERVNYYKKLIRAGYKPRVLTLSHNNLGLPSVYSNTEFILDGHHKLLAYLYLGVPCNFVSITKENTEDEIYKKTLFNKYSYFLTDELKENIFNHNPKLNFDDSEESLKYNVELDNYFKKFKNSISADIIRLIYKSFSSTNIEEQKWGLSKLRIIEKKDFSTEKIILYGVIDKHLSLSYREIKSKEEFNFYILETFGKSLDDIEKNIT